MPDLVRHPWRVGEEILKQVQNDGWRVKEEVQKQVQTIVLPNYKIVRPKIRKSMT